MIEMTYQQLSSQQFLNAVQHLARSPLPVKTAYNVKKLADAIMRSRKNIADEYMKELVEPFSKKDENGKLVMTPDGSPEFDENRKDEFKAAEESFGKRTVKIDRQKLFLEALGEITISASELSALDPVLTELHAVVNEPAKA